MIRCGRPPPGFGVAAAGGRPLRPDFGGAKYPTRANVMVNIKTETHDGSLQVQQQSQMQNEAMSSQSCGQTKSSLAGNKNASLAKGPHKRVRADATEVGLPGVNTSSTEQHLRPCKKSKGLGKHGKLEDKEGPTELRRAPTPIDLFEDECVFCHSFRTSEIHGPMVQYRKGRIVSSDEGNPTNAMYVHKKCMDWAPQVYFDGDDIINMEKEIRRAKRMKCSRCRLPGAALGCCQDDCPRTYHVPCALMILECRWDVENRHVWCPKHASNPLPCDKMSSPIMESDITSSILQNQWSDKGLSADYQREEKLTKESTTLVNEWVLLGSVLSTSEKNKTASLPKGPYKRACVDATEVASPGVNASSTEQYLRPCKKSKGLGKHGKLEDNEGPTELRRAPTPIDVFEDECVFCHSFRTSEIHGPMVQYRKGRIVSGDEGNPTNAMYVHRKCMDWAPKVYFDGDDIVNMETEIERAKGLNCSRCGLPGAALGCYEKSCRRTYHVPCAVMIPECCWDIENHNVWCPNHAAVQLPCSTMIRNQCPANKEISADSHMEDTQNNPLFTSTSSLPKQVPGKYLNKKLMPVSLRREDQQVHQLNTLSSSFSQGQCSYKEGISAGYCREERQINQSRTPMDQWILLSSVLSASEKDSLKDFASLTSSTLAEEWDKNVTHIIVGRSAGISCGRSYEVLMAILSGKWVVTAGWIADCLAGPIPDPKTCLAEPITVPAISYEVEFFDASHLSIDGPKKGRARAAKGAPNLFSGLHFCLSAYMYPDVRENIKELIAAAGGQVLEAMSPRLLHENLGKNPAKVYFIYVSGPPRDYASTLFAFEEIEEERLYRASGAQTIRHLWLFDAIAAYDARMLEQSYRKERSLGVAFSPC